MSQEMLNAVENYIKLFNQQDAKAIADLYADDATVSDPIGTLPKKGKDEILAFYERAVKNGATLTQSGPTRIAGNSAAFAFTVCVGTMTHTDKAVDVEIDLPTGGMTIDVIDTFMFDDNGKVTEMNAYWGPTNITQL